MEHFVYGFSDTQRIYSIIFLRQNNVRRISDCNKRNLPINLNETLLKAKSLYDCVKGKLENLTEKEKSETFGNEETGLATRGWWDRYSKRMNIGSVNQLGEAGSADLKRAKEFPEELKQIINGKPLS